MVRSSLALTLIVLFLGTAFPASAQKADIAYTNGKIYTVNEAQPWVEAVAIIDGKFTAVGSAADVMSRR